MSSPTTSLRALLVALGLVAVPGLLAAPILVGSAYAQDDDDDDGGDDDDDDWDAGSSDDDDDDDDEPWMGGRIVRRPAPVAAPLPEQADDQVVVASLDAEGRDVLLKAGFLIISESSGRLLLELPDDLDVEAALAAVRKASPEALVAPNSYYRSQAVPVGCEGAMCEHWEAVEWPPVSVGATCTFAPHIGLIDTGVNLDHPMLSQARLTLETIGNVDAEPSELKHGTAVVAMFVGSGRVPGLAPAAEVLVVDPFGRVGQDERSDVFALADAIDRLATAEVDVASLSLAGPDNAILADAISRIQTAGIPVVAAVGNAGPRAEAMYPAAYPDVVAVTAVDRRQNIYRRAVQGEHVSFAAPGVDISTAASISGIRPQTGTSFAVPFVTTALAAALAKGVEPPAAMDALAAASLDLGEPGRDAVFGWGVVRIPSPC